jgi:hypothetical protein
MYAGMPLQEGFTEALLSGREAGGGASGKVVEHLRKFINGAFDHKTTAGARYWPELEDIFTCVDLSANTGHNLGPTYRASDLRTARRALIYRIMTMLREQYLEARARKDKNWGRLTALMHNIDSSRAGFISTNWDTVVEDLLEETQQVEWFDYGCDAAKALLHPSHNEIRVEEAEQRPAPYVIKMHGSVNWLYCENCRHLYWIPPEYTKKVAGQLLSPEEWQKIDPESAHPRERWSCNCGGSLGTRLATFSYLKALEFPMFQKSWFSAEKILRAADNWIFIGYSLPGADFEFKYLLKRVQLSRRKPPNFAVISGGPAADRTYDHYQRFFGRQIKRDTNFFGNGLDSATIRQIAQLSG